MVRERIPPGVIERLSSYLNCLMQLQGRGEKTVSSKRLGALVNVNPAQVRRDFTYFGTFGRKGVGYEVEMLVAKIQRILGSDAPHRLALVGAGNLGSAIAHYAGLERHGFYVAAIFDNDPTKVGSHIGKLEVFDVKNMPRIIRNIGISIGVVAVPPMAAQKVTDMLVEGGVKVILNYTPMMVSAPPEIKVHNTDPVKELLYTLYYLTD